MIHAQNEKVVADIAVQQQTTTATIVIDTIGYDHASVTVLRGAGTTTFGTALRVDESDDNVTYTSVTALVGGGAGGFSIPSVPVGSTGVASIVKMDIDTKAKKRYLRVSYTPGANNVAVGLVARLGRGQNAPVTAAEAGVIGLVKG